MIGQYTVSSLNEVQGFGRVGEAVGFGVEEVGEGAVGEGEGAWGADVVIVGAELEDRVPVVSNAVVEVGSGGNVDVGDSEDLVCEDELLLRDVR